MPCEAEEKPRVSGPKAGKRKCIQESVMKCTNTTDKSNSLKTEN